MQERGCCCCRALFALPWMQMCCWLQLSQADRVPSLLVLCLAQNWKSQLLIPASADPAP